MADLGAETWIIHGTLLGWWWNRKSLPWDSDVDVQMTATTVGFLASYYNMTVHMYKRKQYMLEINPRYTDGSFEDKLNVIDGRWIDMQTGLFIDITAVRVKAGTRGEVLASKDKHEESTWDLFPLRESLFEGMPVKVPYNYVELLQREYGRKALTTLEHSGYVLAARLLHLKRKGLLMIGTGIGSILRAWSGCHYRQRTCRSSCAVEIGDGVARIRMVVLTEAENDTPKVAVIQSSPMQTEEDDEDGPVEMGHPCCEDSVMACVERQTSVNLQTVHLNAPYLFKSVGVRCQVSGHTGGYNQAFASRERRSGVLGFRIFVAYIGGIRALSMFITFLSDQLIILPRLSKQPFSLRCFDFSMYRSAADNVLNAVRVHAGMDADTNDA